MSRLAGEVRAQMEEAPDLKAQLLQEFDPHAEPVFSPIAEDDDENFIKASNGIQIPPEELLKQVKELMDEAEEAPIEQGSVWYVVSMSWINAWARWCQQGGQTIPFPSMDNSDIIDVENFHLSPELIGIKYDLHERKDYLVLPEAAWTLIHAQYGTEGLPIIRRAYEYARGETRIEVDLAQIHFTFESERLEEAVQISHAHGVADLKKAIQTLLEHKYPSVSIPSQLYFCFSLDDGPSATRYTLNDGEEWAGQTVEEVGLLAPDSHVWVDLKPCAEARSMKAASAPVEESDLKPGAGLVGLRNLGNTCFMNSALQCLSNCDPLRRYFLSGAYRTDVNKSNRLGTGGVLVEEFAALVRSIWSASPHSIFDPLSFKYALGRFEGRFMGYHQQDSQEFLSALLDRVHEDLNRVQVKPYTETPDRAGRSDTAVADETWELHRSRNDSQIVDLFHGQLKSTVTCPTCSHISVTFDPFMFLSLPMPAKRARNIRVVILSEDLLDEADLAVPKRNRTIAGLKEAVLKRLGLSCETHEVEMVEIFNGDIYRTFTDEGESLGNIRQPGDTIHAYVLRRDVPHVWLTFMCARRRIGYPILLPCVADPVTLSEEDLPAMLHKSLSRYSQNPRLEHVEEQLAFHSRKRETPLRFPSVHVFIQPDFLETFVADASSEESPEDRPTMAFYHLFMSHHGRLPSPSAAAMQAKDEVGLYECLDLYVQEEQLSSTESWYCSVCKEHQEGAGKKLDLWRMPEILVVHLKRFAYDSYYGHKIGTAVAFPIKYSPLLEMFPFTYSRCSDLNFQGRVLDEASGMQGLHYELFAVSEHFGGMGGGHCIPVHFFPIILIFP